MTMERIEQIENAVRDRVGAALRKLGAPEETSFPLVKPPSPEMGDMALPCFPFAKTLRQAPQKIAEQLAAHLAGDDLIAQAEPFKGYLNIRIEPAALIQAVLGQVLAEGDSFASNVPTGAHYVVEYSSPNTNKPLHLGHVRNNVLGLSVCRILKHVGHKVTAVCLVNDRGIHICKTMVAYSRWGHDADPVAAGAKGDHYVGKLYVEYAARLDEEYQTWLHSDQGQARFQEWKERHTKDGKEPTMATFEKAFSDEFFNKFSELGGETRELLRLWEASDPKVRALWSRMNGWVDAGFDVTYKRLGVQFDKIDRESDTYKLGREVVEQGLEQGYFHRLDDGAVVCDYEKLGIKGGKNPHKVLLRGDGTTVYTTQDLGTALARHDEHGFDKQVYVVGDEQKHHFRVLFALLALIRPKLADACEHLAYGMVNLPEGKMKSREGKVVDADDLMDEIAQLAAVELKTRAQGGRAHSVDEDDVDEIQRRAEAIAQGALKFFLLAFAAPSSAKFDPAKSIDFLGKTGPYCLNAYARTRQLLRKAGGEPPQELSCLEALGTDKERNVVRALQAMPAEIGRAAENLDPSKVVDATFEVAKAFNQLFTDKEGHPIVGCKDPALRQARLLLTVAVGHALKMGLALLGIEVLDEM